MADRQVALVTGSSSGIGAAVARRLAGEGMRVVVNSARSVRAGEELAAELPGAVYVRADISVEQEARDLVAAALDHCGRLDVLVNNAGVSRPIPHADLDAANGEVWREIFGVNVFGTWQTTVAALPALTESGDGRVVNISSLAGTRPAGSSIPYAVSKAAVDHLTRLLAKTCGPAVRVNAVAPGLTQTPWMRDAEFWGPIVDQVRELTPLRRVAQPEDVAEAVRCLIATPHITGQVLLIDGGAHLV